jgi:hypothetical protein
MDVDEGAKGGDEERDLEDYAKVEMAGFVTNGNFSMPKGVFILFINDRAVECLPLKRAVDALFAEILPKHRHPFVYLSLQMPPHHIDVNLHPTKREVGFLHQESIVDAIGGAVRNALQTANASRDFAVQQPLTFAATSIPASSSAADGAATPVSSSDTASGAASQEHFGPRRRSNRTASALVRSGSDGGDSKGADDEDKGNGGVDEGRRRHVSGETGTTGVGGEAQGRLGDHGEKGPVPSMRRSATSGSSTSSKIATPAPQRKVRTDARTLRLDAFLTSTARSEEVDKVRGLETGADDYISKPYSIIELLARVKAHLRRSRPATMGERLIYNDILLDSETHKVFRGEKELKLGPTEFRLLTTFMEKPGRVWSRDQLLDRVWGRDIYVDTRTVDVHVGRLRKVLGSHGGEDLIRTVRGAGYALG